MQFIVDDDLSKRFKAALEKSGEDETTVIARMFKTYVHEVFSRKVETFYALEPFMKRPGKP